MQEFAYQAILPLKLLLQQKSNPDSFHLMDRLMDHKEARMQDPYWNECQEHVVDRLRIRCGLESNPDFDEESIHRIIGILEVNAYEIFNTGKCGARGLFPIVSFRQIYLF